MRLQQSSEGWRSGGFRTLGRQMLLSKFYSGHGTSTEQATCRQMSKSLPEVMAIAGFTRLLPAALMRIDVASEVSFLILVSWTCMEVILTNKLSALTLVRVL